MKRYIKSTTEDNSYANHLIKISGKDAKYALSNLNKSHKTLGLYGVPGDAGYYVSEFEEATPGYMWASNKGLQILDDAGISYELIKKATMASTRISANIELIDTIGHIKNDNGKFDVCVVETPYADMQLATYDPVADEYDILETVKDLDDARKKATTQFKSQPEFVMASDNPFYDKLSDYDKRVVDAKLRKDYPYQIVSMAAILRDYIKPEYVGKFHEKLVDIADSIYNVGSSVIDDFLPEYKEIYDRFGKDYFDLVLKDMRALDGQITSNAKVEELLADYEDRINSSALSAINMSTKVTAATNYDTKLIAKWLKAKFDDEAFGTAYTMHRISDADAYMGRNKLTYNRKNNTIELIGNTPEEDTPIYKVIPQYSSTKKQGTYAPKLPKLIPIDEWNATHGVTASTRVMASRWYYYEPMSEQELADLEADILALPGCDKLDMDTHDMEEIGYIMLLPGYNDIPLSDPQYYEKRKQLLKDILRVAKEHGLSRTEDRIEDYGSCWYIVLRTNKPKTDEYDEYDY